MLDLLINPTNTLTDFVYATKNGDIDSIAGLLDDAGVFEIEQINSVLVEVNKNIKKKI
jgi:hypothetical protein